MLIARDAEYGQKKNQKCDVYYSYDHEVRNVVMVVHGGAWIFGKKDDLEGISRYLFSNCKVAVVTPDYSLSQIDSTLLQQAIVMETIIVFALILLVPCKLMKIFLFYMAFFLMSLTCVFMICAEPRSQNTHPQHVNDIAQCLQWLRASAEIYRFNPDHIFLLGHSSGAHLISLLSLNTRFLDNFHIPLSCIKGVVCISGPYSFWRIQDSTVRWILNRSVFNDDARGMTKENLKRLSTDYKSMEQEDLKTFDRWGKIVDAWPIFHGHKVSSDTPPFLLLTAAVDLSLLKHNNDLKKMLQENNVYVQHLHHDNVTHFSIRKNWDTKNKKIGQNVADFINIIQSTLLSNE